MIRHSLYLKIIGGLQRVRLLANFSITQEKKRKKKNKLDFNILFFSGNIKKTLALISQAADSICDGDLVGRLIREKGNWSLLPMQVCQLDK